MQSPLTVNAILAISTQNAQDIYPLVQVVDIRQIGNAQSTQERFRLVLSDGAYLQQAMLATQLNELIKSGSCMKNSCVRLKEYICNTVQNKKIIIVLNMDVEILEAEPYGEPVQVPLVDDNAAPGNPGVAAQQPAPVLRPPPQQPYAPVSSASRPAGGGNFGPDPRGGPPGPYNSNSAHSAPPPQGARAFGGGAPTDRSGGFSGGPGHNSSVAGYGAGGGFNNGPRQGPPVSGNGVANHGVKAGYGQSGPAMGGNNGGYISADAGGQMQYGRGPYQAQVESPATYSGRGPIVRNEAPAVIMPIRSLNPYQSRWTIKARVTGKGIMKRYNNANGEGCLFSFDLLDAEGGEIRATCFKDSATTLFEVIEVGQVYTLSKGTIKAANKQYNHLKNEWELNLDNKAIVERCEDDPAIPVLQYSLIPINKVEELANNTTVDVIGVVVTVHPTQPIMRRTGQETQKRTLQIRDQSGMSVDITMWDVFCTRQGQELQELCDSGQAPVLLLKGGRISEFNGKSVGTVSTSVLCINPDIREAHVLREWFDREGKNLSCLSVSKEGGGVRSEVRKTIAQIKDEGLGRTGKPDWIAVRATVAFIKADNPYYTACPVKVGDKQCNKKVTNDGDGKWRCEKCNQTFNECDYRYVLSLQVQDHSGTTWLTAFQEPGEELMGMSSRELHQLKEEQNPLYDFAFRNVSLSQRLFKLKVYEDSYNDEIRVKCNVVKVEKLNYAQECELLLVLIDKLVKGEPIHSTSATNAIAASGSGVSQYERHSNPQTTAAVTGDASYGQGEHRQSYQDNNMYNGGGAGGGGGGGGGGGSNSKCYTCGSEGHYARECPNGNSRGGGNFGGGFDNSYGRGNSGGRGNDVCYKCQEPGHWASNCPKQGGAGAGRGGTGRGFGGGSYNSGGGYRGQY